MDNNSASTEFKQLIAKGKDQGYLTIDEINDLMRLNTSMIASMNLMKVADDMYNKAINIRE